MSKEVAKRKGSEVGAPYDYGDAAGLGYETFSKDDLSIPFIAVLQSNSPQVENGDPEGSKPGQLFNTVTRELVDGEEGMIFQPVYKHHAFVEWVPRDDGGGFVGMHDIDSQVVKDAIADNDGRRFGKLKTNGNDLIETYYVYGFTMSPDGKQQTGYAILSFSSTKIKPAKDWFAAMNMIKKGIPLFANRAVLRTTKQKNTKGTFHNFSIGPMGKSWLESLIDPSKEGELLAEAHRFYDMVRTGVAKADFSQQKATGEEDGESETPF